MGGVPCKCIDGETGPRGINGTIVSTSVGGIFSKGETKLFTLDVNGLPDFATRAWVESVGDWYQLVPNTGVASFGVELVDATDGRQWKRQHIPNPTHYARQFWALDPQNVSGVADDENEGWGATVEEALTRPIRNPIELVNRLEGAQYPDDGFLPQINLMSDSPPICFKNISAQGSSEVNTGGAFLSIVGTPTLIHSGTLTSGTAAPSGNGDPTLCNTPQIVVDSALPTSWTASGLISDGSRARFINQGNVWARLTFETAVPKTAHTSLPIETVAGAVQPQIGQNPNHFTTGAYNVYSFPKIAGVSCSGGITVRLYTVEIEDGDSGFLGPFTGGLYTILCSTIKVTAIGFLWRAYMTERWGGTLYNVNFFWVYGSTLSNRIGGVGDAEFWVNVSLGTSGCQQIIQATLVIRGGCSSNRNLSQSRFGFFDGEPGSLLIKAPTNLDIDFTAGSNAGTHDHMILIQSRGVNIFSDGSFQGWGVNNYGGEPVQITNVGNVSLATLQASGYQNSAKMINIVPFDCFDSP